MSSGSPLHSTNRNLIHVVALTHIYTPERAMPIPALRDVNLEIAPGEYVALIGPNGSGKSTLARHLNALLLPTSGDVWINGLNTQEQANHRAIRTFVGMVFQVPADQIVATVVEEDVAFGPENLGVAPAELRERVRESLARVGMWEWRDRPPHMLSPGQQQRVAIAGVLAMRPRCLVLDEATAMLDPGGRREVWRIVETLHAEGLTVLTITHDMDEAARAGRVIALNQGRIVLDGSPQEVWSEVTTLATIGLAQPSVAKLARGLHRRFPSFPVNTLTVDDLATAVARVH